MRGVVIKHIVPSDGNPEGLIEAPEGALFYKSNKIYKINYGGMGSSVWKNVTFSPFNKSPIFLTNEDLSEVPIPYTGSYVYEKSVEGSAYGWKFLSNKGMSYSKPKATPSITRTPTTTPTRTPTRTPALTPTRTPTRTPTNTPTLSQTVTPTLTKTPTRTPTLTITTTPTLTVSQTVTPTVTLNPTPTLTVTPTNTPTLSPTVTPTEFTPTPTVSQTVTPTLTLTISQTVTPTTSQTATPTPTEFTPTPTFTVSQTVTPTFTPTLTITESPTPTLTEFTPTPTVSQTVTPTISQTVTPTFTPTISPTQTLSQTITPTISQTVTPTISQTVTPTFTPTISQTITPTISQTVTPTVSQTVTPTVTPTITPGTAPLAMWRINEGVGTALNDSSGNNYNAGMFNFSTPGTLSSGWSGGYLNFDGTSTYATASNGLTLNGISFTATMWTKRATNGTWHVVLGQYTSNSGNNNLHIGYRDTDKFTVAFYSDDLITSNTYPDAGNWVHWAVTYNRVNGARQILRNGSVVASDNASGTLGVSGVLNIGKRADNLLYFSGSLEDVRIYNSVLSTAEIASIAGVRPTPTPTPTPTVTPP